MATIKMRKGNLYADIFDSKETIETAEKEGYVKVTETEPKVQKVEVKEVKVEKPTQIKSVTSK